MGNSCSNSETYEQQTVELYHTPIDQSRRESNYSQTDTCPTLMTNYFHPQVFNDDDFETEVVQAVDDCMTPLLEKYLVKQHNNIGVTMSQGSIHKFSFHWISCHVSDKKQNEINKNRYDTVISNESKQQPCNQIYNKIKAPFDLQAADLNHESKKLAASYVQSLIERIVDAKLNNITVK